jgi:hypothetical protein
MVRERAVDCRPRRRPGFDSPITSLVAAAQRCHERGREAPAGHVARLARLVALPDDDFCRDVADRFERLPRLTWNAALERRYRRLKRETRSHYEAVLEAGIAVEPWLRPGQPYRDAGDLVRKVRETGTIHVFLTRDGHGPARSGAFHPMREPSGVLVRGVELRHNDLLRVVHDVFGHVMFGHGFGLGGELKAAYIQMALLSESARLAVFTEQVAQTCWFFFGPHLRDERGRVRGPGDRGYVPPHRRPFPEQKVFAARRGDLEAFGHMFEFADAA